MIAERPSSLKDPSAGFTNTSVGIRPGKFKFKVSNSKFQNNCFSFFRSDSLDFELLGELCFAFAVRIGESGPRGHLRVI